VTFRVDQQTALDAGVLATGCAARRFGEVMTNAMISMALTTGSAAHAEPF
jgi:hypothetical protein